MLMSTNIFLLFIWVNGRVPARVVLYFLSLSGFLVSFIMRNDMNIAIVAMVEQESPTATTGVSSNCYAPSGSPNSTVIETNGGTLQWSSKIQSYIISIFFWAYIISQLLGGIITQKFGTKIVFGYSQLLTALCSLCIPWASTFHYSFVIVLRFIQGFASGLTWPAMYALVGHWIPNNERSRFMSSFQGLSLGIGLTYQIGGFLISYLGWRSMFYFSGISGVSWCILWYFLAFDSPESHPRISRSEVKYIQNNTDNTFEEMKKQEVPWRKIFMSKPVLAIAITTFGRIWLHYVFITMGPTYMKKMLGFSIEKNGLLSGSPFILSYFSTLKFCYITDKLVNNGWMSLTNSRKLMTGISQVVPSILLIALVNGGCEIILILFIWYLAVIFITASYAGAMANVVDIAPNLAGSVLAYAQTIHMTASFLSPLINFNILDGKEHVIDAWKKVVYLSAGIGVSTYCVYQLWGTGDLQEWNTSSPALTDDSEEKKVLNKKDGGKV